MPETTPSNAAPILVLAALLAGCASQPPPVTPSQTAAEPLLPERFQGHWTNALDNCDLESGDPTQWAFIGSQTAGSFEHSYNIYDVDVGEDFVRFSSRGGGRLTMRELGDGKMEFIQQDGSVSVAVKCP